MTKDKRKIIIIAILALIIIAFPFLSGDQYKIQFVINMFTFAYFATAWNILGGYSGQIAMGNGVYVGVGAYVGATLWLQYGVSPWIGMIIGGCFAAVMAFLYGLIVFRLSGTYFALSTVALLHITRMIIYTNQEIFGLKTGGAVGLFIHWKEDSFVGMQFSDKTWYYFIILIMLCLAVFISASIKNSKLGYYLSAIKTNPDAAASLGVNVMKCKVIANCISAFLLACGGVFFVFLQTVVDPLRVLGYELSQQILLYCVVGGLGTLGGPIASAFILSPLSDILRGTLGSQYAGLSLVVYGIVLMLIIMFLPNGIWPLIEKLFRPIFSKSSSKSGPIAGNTGREGE